MSRSNPITWRNVGVNDGSSSASLGNAASGFGRTALQGFDILSTQMGDRITREDTLLTNEAIAQALSGGPKVSTNRRVDAGLLQQAVERDELGNRQERILEDDLLSSAVSRRLTGAQADKAVKDVETYDERFALDKKTAESEAALRATQAEAAKLNMEEIRRKRAEEEADRVAFANVNAELFGPERQQQAAAQFEADWAQNAPPGATAEDKAIARQNFLETAQQEVFNNPRLIQEMALKYGTTPLKLYQGTAFGQRAFAAQQAADAAIAERAALTAEQQKTVITNAQKFSAGNTDMVRFDGSDYVFEKDTTANDATFDSAFKDAKVNEEDPLLEGLKSKIQSRFKSASVSEQLIKEIVKDGKIPANYSQLVDDRAAQLKQRAIDAQKQTVYTGSGDKMVDLQNYYDAIASRTSKETTAEEAGNAISAAPIVAASAINEINTNPQTTAERDEAKNALALSVEGLLQARDDVKLPENASNELRALYNRFRSQVEVANGGAYVPERPTIGMYDIGGIDRPIKPKFGDRKAFAVDAATTLQQLQQLIEKETKQAEADKLRRSLD